MLFCQCVYISCGSLWTSSSSQCAMGHRDVYLLRSTEKTPKCYKKSDIFELKLNLMIKLSIQSLPVSSLVKCFKT